MHMRGAEGEIIPNGEEPARIIGILLFSPRLVLNCLIPIVII